MTSVSQNRPKLLNYSENVIAFKAPFGTDITEPRPQHEARFLTIVIGHRNLSILEMEKYSDFAGR